ncbi:MAG: hypothetical protein KF858_10545 [Candidatus Sumerlaeia bacterium]|nr:hypothetical protein [Candidatus Sumerlaeia bacterium]
MKREVLIQMVLLAGALLLMLVAVLKMRDESPLEMPDEDLIRILETDPEGLARDRPDPSGPLPAGRTPQPETVF